MSLTRMMKFAGRCCATKCAFVWWTTPRIFFFEKSITLSSRTEKLDNFCSSEMRCGCCCPLSEVNPGDFLASSSDQKGLLQIVIVSVPMGKTLPFSYRCLWLDKELLEWLSAAEFQLWPQLWKFPRTKSRRFSRWVMIRTRPKNGLQFVPYS